MPEAISNSAILSSLGLPRDPYSTGAPFNVIEKHLRSMMGNNRNLEDLSDLMQYRDDKKDQAYWGKLKQIFGDPHSHLMDFGLPHANTGSTLNNLLLDALNTAPMGLRAGTSSGTGFGPFERTQMLRSQSPYLNIKPNTDVPANANVDWTDPKHWSDSSKYHLSLLDQQVNKYLADNPPGPKLQAFLDALQNDKLQKVPSITGGAESPFSAKELATKNTLDKPNQQNLWWEPQFPKPGNEN